MKRKNIAVFPGDEDTMAVLKYAEEAAQGADPHGLVHIYREMLRNRLLQRLWDPALADVPQRYPRPSRSSKKTRSPTLPIPNEGGLDYYTNDGS